MRRLAPVVLFLVLLFVLWVPAAAAWTWPVSGPVLQGFSFDAAHPYAGGQHRGVDIGAPASGAPVLAPAAGVVSFAGTVPSSGKSVTIDTPGGLSVTLTHLGSIGVVRNAAVAEGAVVGTVGPSGTPELDGPYVHLGIRTAADAQGYLDPLAFLPVLGTPAPLPAPVPADPPAAVAPPAPVEPPVETAPPVESAPPVETAPPGESAPPAQTAPAPPVETAPPAETVPPAETAPPLEVAPPAEPVSPAETGPPAQSVSPAPVVVPPAEPAAPVVEVSPPAAFAAPVESAPPAVASSPAESPAPPEAAPAPADAAPPAPAPVELAAPGGQALAPDSALDPIEPAPAPALAAAFAAAFGAVLPARPLRAVPVPSGVHRAPLPRLRSRRADLRRGRVGTPAARTVPDAVVRRAPERSAAARTRFRASRAPGAGRSLVPLVLLSLALAGLAAGGLAAARIIRTPSPTSEGARPVAVSQEDPCRAGLAVREWAAPHRPRGGVRRAGGRVRALPPAQGQRRPDGLRDGRARHAGDGVRRPERRLAA